MTRKSEARVARQLAAELKQQQKSARLRSQPEGSVVRSEYAKEAPRQPRAGANPGSIYNLQMTWSCDDPDKEGQWSFGVHRDWGDAVWNADIHPKLEHYRQLKWYEIERMSSDTGHRMHHPMDTGDICDEAIGRLVDIGKVGDTIYRFRLGNMERLWGFRIVAEFHVLWFDPTHQIYPLD